ncbi:threonine aldolase family protein [Anaerovibrio sp.]|uniref:threonine aldolase family protein n=1 Tax=Anaerovibrio sp. TaxID=1872532 RepID=UPI00388D0C0B
MRHNKLFFASDYQEGTHPRIIERLTETNLFQSPGYGTDEFCESARERIRTAIGCPEAAVYFLLGGTQTNATIIDAILKPYEGVIAPDSGHISLHEAGAIEFGGHKVLTIPHQLGKITAETVEEYCKGFDEDLNHDHMVKPGMVYISQPTEYGTLYSLHELTELSRVCRSRQICLYVDGARLAYALGGKSNDVSLKDLARLCDVFYIGGTKCGAMLGEAVVIPDPELIPHFFTIMKQHGALLAKGRILGIQFDVLFENGLYESIGKTALEAADKIRESIISNGYRLAFDSPTNQIFISLSEDEYNRLGHQVEFSFWEKTADGQIVVRLATSWATTDKNVEKLMDVLAECSPSR